MVKNDIPTIGRLNLRQWLAVVDQSDYVISVDTAAFHAAGGLGKPTVGIFTFANAETYGQYYPTATLLQGPCPYGYSGCYNWGLCPETKRPKPCLTQLTVDHIIDKVDEMLKKCPLSHSI
jgi:ADP-heptose:LPS heptosyltransferase